MIGVDESNNELALEESTIAFEAEPEVEQNRNSYDLGDKWDGERITRAVDERAFAIVVDGVITKLYSTS